jgi:hypothetical protein
MSGEEQLRQQVIDLLEGGHAHMGFEAAVADFPKDSINHKPPNVPYSPWALLEHIRIAQEDILEFIVDPEYKAKSWPDDYWPEADRQALIEDWRATIEAIQRDRKELIRLASDPERSLVEPFEHAPDYNLLRELLTVADHNAYHLGEFAILRQVMASWGER